MEEATECSEGCGADTGNVGTNSTTWLTSSAGAEIGCDWATEIASNCRLLSDEDDDDAKYEAMPPASWV